jgi:ribosomal-protein-alanine N-acetyltransferase
MIWVEGEMVGQINLGGIAFGALRGANIGYWIDQGHSNRGITTEAVITLTEYAFVELRLHRIEIAFRPENDASKRVAEKSGYSYEGMRPRFLHIDGQWRDHIVYVRENPRID